MSLSFNITTEGNCGILALSGRMIGNDSTVEAMESIEKLLNGGAITHIICDCSGLEYCNSTGLNFFVRLLTKSRNKGGDCGLTNLQPMVQKLFNLSKLNEIFTSFDSVDSAKSSYNTTV